MAPDPSRTQEQSIKARKSDLFDADKPSSTSTGPRRSFADLLKDTPADPLSPLVRALLWTLGTVVVLLLVAALATGGPKKPRPKPVAGTTPPPVARVA
jgi:hypothetical protein